MPWRHRDDRGPLPFLVDVPSCLLSSRAGPSPAEAARPCSAAGAGWSPTSSVASTPGRSPVAGALPSRRGHSHWSPVLLLVAENSGCICGSGQRHAGFRMLDTAWLCHRGTSPEQPGVPVPLGSWGVGSDRPGVAVGARASMHTLAARLCVPGAASCGHGSAGACVAAAQGAGGGGAPASWVGSVRHG